MRQLRSSLSPAQRTLHDRSINEALMDYVERNKPAMLATFWAFDGEPDLMPAMRELDQRGQGIALPVIIGGADQSDMAFRQWRQDTKMVSNCFGIPEPEDTPEVRPQDIDLMLVPLVAWDESGGRLGMGLGFYDRYLRAPAIASTTLLTGVAYQLQKVDQVPLDSWDIGMHAFLSENGWFSCKP